MAGRFTARRDIDKVLASDTGMRRFLGNVADEAAKEVEQRLPYPRILGGLTVRGDTTMGLGGWEGEVSVDGPGWHLWEFGTANNPAKPALRPGVQAVLSRHGGRFKGDT